MNENLQDFIRWIKTNGFNSNIPIKEKELKNLSILDLTKKKIRELPQSIDALENLQILKLSNNRLKFLPNTIGNLKKLKTLQCENNLLE